MGDKSTPTPWRPISYSSVVGASVVAQPDPKENSVTVAMIPGPDRATAESNAALIVHAVNRDHLFGELVEALEGMLGELHDGVTPLLHIGKPGAFDICTRRIAKARAVLSKVKDQEDA